MGDRLRLELSRRLEDPAGRRAFPGARLLDGVRVEGLDALLEVPGPRFSDVYARDGAAVVVWADHAVVMRWEDDACFLHWLDAQLGA